MYPDVWHVLSNVGDDIGQFQKYGAVATGKGATFRVYMRQCPEHIGYYTLYGIWFIGSAPRYLYMLSEYNHVGLVEAIDGADTMISQAAEDIANNEEEALHAAILSYDHSDQVEIAGLLNQQIFVAGGTVWHN